MVNIIFFEEGVNSKSGEDIESVDVKSGEDIESVDVKSGDVSSGINVSFFKPDSPSSYISPDRDTTLNKISYGVDSAWSGIKDGVSILLSDMGFEDDAKEWRASADATRMSASFKKPTQTPSITTELPEIKKDLSDGEIGEALNKIGGQIETMFTAALPSIAFSTSGIATASAISPFIRPIPYVGPAASIITKLVGALLPSYLAVSGGGYREAKAEGADEESAKMAGRIAGALGAPLDAFAAGTFVKAAIKAIGKDQLINYVGKQTGKKVAKELVEKGLKASTKDTIKKVAKSQAVKGFGKGAVIEGATEAVQEAITLTSAKIAADKEVDFTEKENINQLIDAAALGIVGGGPVRGLIEGLQPIAKRNAVIKAKELQEEIDEAPSKVNDLDNDLVNELESGFTTKSKERESNRKRDELSKPFARTLSFLQPVANRSETGALLVNDLSNFFIDTNQEIGSSYKKVNDIIYDIRKRFRINPFTKKGRSLIDTEINDQVVNQLRYNEQAKDPRAREVANELRKILGDVQRDNQGNIILDENKNPIPTGGIYKELIDAGVDIRFVDNYLTQMYKLPTTGFGRKKAKKKFVEILKEDGYENPTEILDNIINFNGVYRPEEDVNLFDDATPEGQLPTVKKSFEKERTIRPETFKKLDDAGLVEKNVMGLMGKAIANSKRRVKLQQFKNRYGDKVKELGLEKGERDRIREIYKGLQNNYKPFSSNALGKYIQPTYQFSNTAGYITTLPLAAIPSLSEPVIMLSRVQPKNALWGAIQGVRLGAIKTMRLFLPKLKSKGNLGKLEESMNGLLQTADIALNDAVRDIGDLSINKKITDAFFKFNFLAPVTQMSRYMAFAATQKQIQDDVLTLQKSELAGNLSGVDKMSVLNAKKRLKEQGLGNLVRTKQGTTDLTLDKKFDQIESLQAQYDDIDKVVGKNKFHTNNKRKKLRREFNNSREGKRLAQLKREVKSKKRVREMSNRDEILNWAENFGKEGVEVEEPPIITKAIGKTVDEIIMTPNILNRPLWMSNPWLSPVAQLKGFMMVFGNTVGMRFYREIFKPLGGFVPGSKREGRIPVDEAFKYALTFTLLMAALYGTATLKEAVKYGDEDSPLDELEDWELMAYLIKSSNILGFGNVLIDALNSEQYGIPFPFSALGPVPVKSIKLSSSLKDFTQGNPASLANWISKNTPIVSALPYEGEGVRGTREGLREILEENLETPSEFLGEIFED
jgi:hypothetical protein